MDKDIQKGYLIIEDTNTGRITQLAVGPQYLRSYWKRDHEIYKMICSDGESYCSYPHNDSYMVNGRLVLSFGSLVLAVDTNSQVLLGGIALTIPEYRHVMTPSFWFHSKENIPLVVIESKWEGRGKYNAIVDFSGDEIKVEKIEDLDKAIFVGLFDLKKVTWENGGVKLSLYTEKVVSDEVADIIEGIKNDEDEQEIKMAEEKAVARLKQNKSYYDVKCMLSPGPILGCFAAVDLVVYFYKPGGQLQKL